MTVAEKQRSATRMKSASRFELPLLGSNQDSPDPESNVRHDLSRVAPLSNSTVGRPVNAFCLCSTRVEYVRDKRLRHNELGGHRRA